MDSLKLKQRRRSHLVQWERRSFSSAQKIKSSTNAYQRPKPLLWLLQTAMDARDRYGQCLLPML
jgi:hypothetical protein